MKVSVTLLIAIAILAFSSATLGYAYAASQFHGSLSEIERKIDLLTYSAEVINAREHVEDSFYYVQVLVEDECIAESMGKVLNVNLTVKSDIKASANLVFLKKLKQDLVLLNKTSPLQNIELHEKYVSVLRNYIKNYEKYVVYFENGGSCSKLRNVLAQLNNDYNKLLVLTDVIVKNVSK